jgi:putative ABC transport system permease protein
VTSRVTVAGRPDDAKGAADVIYRTASAEYLRTTGMRVVRGRWFADADMRSPDAAGFVVNQAMASQLWPNADPVGQVITLRRASQARPDFGQPISGTVIGVVGDVHQFGKDAAPAPEVFVPYSREVWPWITLVVRARSPERVIPALRRAVLAVDPGIPVGGQSVLGGAVSVKSLLADSLARRRLSLSLIGTFGATALLLAAIGLYGVIAYSVVQRTRELGIRTALGATRGSIVRLVLGSGIRVAAVGVAIGLVGARAAAKLIEAVLFETTPTDPASYAAVPALLAAVAIVASYWPARRAVRVDPVVAMRDE